MTERDEMSEWEAIRQFRGLSTEAERTEQLFLMALASARSAKEAARLARATDDKVSLQNGRVAKLEARWLGGAAVVGFLLVVIPILLVAVSLLK